MAMHVSPADLIDLDPEMIVTLIDVLSEQAKRTKGR